ncbi:MAG: protein of unknown function DUF2442 [Idiomarinaceae bacterium HL-53]|nr:MAG: protein of unknown function DUF2442 [Idiomarinaceae bacterium HL-53]CUS47233.1 Protein of unknown function (DUF2442) [Idiomarinaceae bacterium HL-53]
MESVVSVYAKPNYVLHVLFSDGTAGDVCLASSLFGPVFESLKDPARFAQVAVDEYGAICWPKHAYGTPDLAPDALYRQLISTPTGRS